MFVQHMVAVWVGIEPAAMLVLAEAHPPEAEPLKRLAELAGGRVEQRSGYPSLLLLDEEGMGTRSADDVVTAAFDAWLAWRREH